MINSSLPLLFPTRWFLQNARVFGSSLSSSKSVNLNTYNFDEWNSLPKNHQNYLNTNQKEVTTSHRYLACSAENDSLLWRCSSLSCRHVGWMVGGGIRSLSPPPPSLLLLAHPLGSNLFLSIIFLCFKNSRWRLDTQRRSY